MEKLKYISLFSGIEAASVAWGPLGWEPIAFSEIEPFPCALLKQRFPQVPNLGDITKIDWSSYRGKADVIVGGSPCQSFSIAGNREGLKGESGLMFEYIRAVREVLPRYFVWENVPGALSSEKGAAFGQLLHEMDVIGYGLAWRVLDAQFFGVAQRRRRVFLVGCLGNAGRAAQILFDGESMCWDYPSSREKRKGLAEHAKRRLASRRSMLARRGSGDGRKALGRETSALSPCIGFSGGQTAGAGSIGAQEEIAPTLRGGASETNQVPDVVYLSQRGAPSIDCLPFSPTQVTSRANGSNPQWGDPCHTLSATDRPPYVVCGTQYGDEIAGTLTARYDSSPCADRGMNVICVADASAKAAIDEDLSGTLHVGGDPSFVAIEASNGEDVVGALCARDYKGVGSQYVTEGKVIAQQINSRYVVRKLMPVECERLQGFPDGWTATEIKGKSASDGARYKALGNSMAVPVMAWIGKRIARFDA